MFSILMKKKTERYKVLILVFTFIGKLPFSVFKVLKTFSGINIFFQIRLGFGFVKQNVFTYLEKKLEWLKKF